jgi:hypothetical protein
MELPPLSNNSDSEMEEEEEDEDAVEAREKQHFQQHFPELVANERAFKEFPKGSPTASPAPSPTGFYMPGRSPKTKDFFALRPRSEPQPDFASLDMGLDKSLMPALSKDTSYPHKLEGMPPAMSPLAAMELGDLAAF